MQKPASPKSASNDANAAQTRKKKVARGFEHYTNLKDAQAHLRQNPAAISRYLSDAIKEFNKEAKHTYIDGDSTSKKSYFKTLKDIRHDGVDVWAALNKKIEAGHVVIVKKENLAYLHLVLDAKNNEDGTQYGHSKFLQSMSNDDFNKTIAPELNL